MFLSLSLSDWLLVSSLPLSPSLDSCHSGYDVYLGGSHGATSWRHNDVIPILRQHQVTYFDPQISHWDPALISVEQTAKDQVSHRQGGRGQILQDLKGPNIYYLGPLIVHIIAIYYT